MKKVLLISAFFPPQQGGTSEKMAKRVKYFSRFGWHTAVLTPEIPETATTDDGLLVEICDAQVEVIRTKYLFKQQWPSLRHDKNRFRDFYGSKVERIIDMGFVPKGYVRWLPYALREGRKIVKDVDVILSMNNPITLHVIGYLLHKWSGKPWVAEIRDPIAGYAYGRRGPETMNYWLERKIIESAHAVIQREDGTPEDIRGRYPAWQDKFVIIPYAGFDSDDFPAVTPPSQRHERKLVISYTGSFYGNTITPIPFLDGLAQFLAEFPDARGVIKVLFAGDWDAQYDMKVSQNRLEQIVEYHGRVSRKACIQLWQESDALLLILGKEEDNLLRIPSKFWDYLGARRFMLALVDPNGRVAQLVREEQLGDIANTDQPAEIAAMLRRMWQAYQQGQLQPRPNTEFLKQAERAYSEWMTVSVFEQLTK